MFTRKLHFRCPPTTATGPATPPTPGTTAATTTLWWRPSRRFPTTRCDTQTVMTHAKVCTQTVHESCARHVTAVREDDSEECARHVTVVREDDSDEALLSVCTSRAELHLSRSSSRFILFSICLSSESKYKIYQFVDSFILKICHSGIVSTLIICLSCTCRVLH